MYSAIVLDYGHGGQDPNTGEYLTPGGKQYRFTDRIPNLWIGEGITNRQTAARLIALLLQSGVRVLDCVARREWTTAPAWTDLEQADVPLQDRVDYCNKHADTLVLSLHSNAVGETIEGPSRSARGVAVFTSPGKTAADGIATALDAAFREAFEGEPVSVRSGDWSDGDVDREANFKMLRGPKAPAVLVECLFFTNLVDAEYLLSPRGQDVIAGAYLEGVLPHLTRSAPRPLPAPERAGPGWRAYAAWVEASDGVGPRGRPLSPWAKLPEDERRKWRAVARAVRFRAGAA